MSALGLPVLTQTQIQNYQVGVPGTPDVIWSPRFDFVAYPSAGGTQFTFYSNPIGQGVTSTPGGGAGVAKTLYDTNLAISNQLTKGNQFLAVGSETLVLPGVSNAALPLTIQPGRSNTPGTATSIGVFVNDVWSILNGGLKTLAVGTDRNYIQDGPLLMFPPVARLAVHAALATGATASGEEIAYATGSGAPYSLVPIFIDSNQSFTLTVTFQAAIPTPSQQIARLGDRLRGYLIRQAT